MREEKKLFEKGTKLWEKGKKLLEKGTKLWKKGTNDQKTSGKKNKLREKKDPKFRKINQIPGRKITNSRKNQEILSTPGDEGLLCMPNFLMAIISSE